MRHLNNQNRIFAVFFFGFLVTLYFISMGSKLNSSEPLFQDNPQIGGTNWVAPKSASKVKNPLKGNDNATKDGKVLFTNYCVSCHGPKGEGNGVAAASLTPKPKNLTAKQVQDQTDGAIFWKITTGKPPMVSWQAALSDKQRWSLVNYIRELGKK